MSFWADRYVPDLEWSFVQHPETWFARHHKNNDDNVN